MEPSNKGVIVLEDADFVPPKSKIQKSRNQREGRYCFGYKGNGDEPTWKEFQRERKRGRNSRRITAQFFNNGERYNVQNNHRPEGDYVDEV